MGIMDLLRFMGKCRVSLINRMTEAGIVCYGIRECVRAPVRFSGLGV